LYIPQPILPLLAQTYHSDMSTASLLMTAALLPTGIAPLFYGYLLEHVSAKSLLLKGFILLFISFALMFLANTMNQLILIRFFQGLILPAIITALMTYSAISAPAKLVRKFVSIYIATTIVGGFSGRMITGLIIDRFSWQSALLFWFVLIFIGIMLIRQLSSNTEAKFSKPNLKIFKTVFSKLGYWQIYSIVFIMFFVFVSILNTLPFRMKQLDPNVSETIIASVYIAYLIGAIISFNITRIYQWLGGDLKTLMIGLLVFVVGLFLFTSPLISSLFFAMFCLCAGMFCLHATLSGLVNHLSDEYLGVINGFYISSYYLGGALGSWLSSFIGLTR